MSVSIRNRRTQETWEGQGTLIELIQDVWGRGAELRRQYDCEYLAEVVVPYADGFNVQANIVIDEE